MCMVRKPPLLASSRRDPELTGQFAESVGSRRTARTGLGWTGLGACLHCEIERAEEYYELYGHNGCCLLRQSLALDMDSSCWMSSNPLSHPSIYYHIPTQSRLLQDLGSRSTS